MNKKGELLTFGQTLLKIRRAKEKTQREIARTIGMDFSYFSRLENDKFESNPTRETIDKIAEALECTPEEREELLAAAGRMDEELEKATRKANQNPDLRELFRATSNMSNEQIRELLQRIRAEMEQNVPADKRKKK
jgi:HTH-type transcriptional regulator, competence development regulator